MDYTLPRLRDTYRSPERRDSAVAQRESVLEKIASSYTLMPTLTSRQYNIDKCNCGNCGCLRPDAIAIFSPAGIAATVAAFGPLSAAD